MMPIEGVTFATAVLCLAAAIVILITYNRMFPWRETQAGAWIVVCFTLLTLRHSITAIDLRFAPPEVAAVLIALWNLGALALYVGLLVWMFTRSDPPNDDHQEGPDH